jgi:alkanesulfonate monooxygenase SsuD/methylene tetrahydromethanopterin reductase-like flavin-dependent oxidoreductase (luciferase family)
MESDYREAGMPYDRPGVRIERLEEALRIVRAMWTQEQTSFEGRYYTITDIAQAAELPAGEQPQILVGGGGRKVLSVAGRHADIVGINATMSEGRITRETAADLAPERVREKVRWVREAAEAAGRNPDALELSSLVFVVALTTGMSVEQVADCPIFLTGPASEICDRLAKGREETGISYVVIQGDDPERLQAFAEGVVAPLT